jgi:hypothetical protein
VAFGAGRALLDGALQCLELVCHRVFFFENHGFERCR